MPLKNIRLSEAHAVYYVNYERGATTLGNGRVGGFVYLLPEGFDTDYDTEVFLRLEDDYEIYSDEYEAAVKELKAWAEPLAQQAAAVRHDRIIADAQGDKRRKRRCGKKLRLQRRSLRRQSGSLRTDRQR